MAKDTGFNLWDSIFHTRKEQPEEQQLPSEKTKTFPKTTLPEKPEWLKQRAQQEKCREDVILEQARTKMTKNLRSEYEAAIKLLKTIPGWKNADQLAVQCREAIAQRDKLEEAERQSRVQRQKKDRRFVGRAKLVVAAMIALVVAAGAFFVYRLVTSGSEYVDPLKLIEAGEYDKADQELQQKIDRSGPGSWRDTIYDVAENYAQKGEKQRAYYWYKTLGGYNDANEKAEKLQQQREWEQLQQKLEQLQQKLGQLLQISTGSVIELGEFAINPTKWQPDQKAQWIILAIVGEKALVVSRDILNVQVFHEKEKDINWIHSNLRSWLKEEFYVNAFADREKEFICRTRLEVDVNPEYGVTNGVRTDDYVFLLSATEVERYLSTAQARKAVATAYAQTQGAENNSWLLRTMGKDSCHVTYVDSEGNIHYEGQPTTQPGGIRPAMWVDLLKLYDL